MQAQQPIFGKGSELRVDVVWTQQSVMASYRLQQCLSWQAPCGAQSWHRQVSLISVFESRACHCQLLSRTTSRSWQFRRTIQGWKLGFRRQCQASCRCITRSSQGPPNHLTGASKYARAPQSLKHAELALNSSCTAHCIYGFQHEPMPQSIMKSDSHSGRF